MKNCLMLIVFIAPLTSVSAALVTYEVIDLPDAVPGQDLWRYVWHVDHRFAPGEGLTLFFDPARYADLQNPPTKPNWDLLVLPPDPFTPDDGWFDALALTPATDPVFQLDFVWLGTGIPGSQPFVFYDAGFDITASGMTAPLTSAPSAGSGGLLLAGLCPALRFTQRRETMS